MHACLMALFRNTIMIIDQKLMSSFIIGQYASIKKFIVN